MDIAGVILTELKQIHDERGAVLHMLRNDAPTFTHFGECYFSEILPGAIKAWKRHRLQTQNLAVPVGKIRMVLYDDRPQSTTRGQIQELELGRPDAYYRITIPKNLWYGFTGISENPALIANCTDSPHDPNESEIMPIDQSSIPYQWHR